MLRGATVHDNAFTIVVNAWKLPNGWQLYSCLALLQWAKFIITSLKYSFLHLSHDFEGTRAETIPEQKGAAVCQNDKVRCVGGETGYQRSLQCYSALLHIMASIEISFESYFLHFWPFLTFQHFSAVISRATLQLSNLNEKQMLSSIGERKWRYFLVFLV